MTLSLVRQAWTKFFFAESSPLPIAVFRIVYGLLVMATLVLLKPDWLAWYGPHGWVSMATASHLAPGPQLNLFRIIPQSDTWIEAFFWIFLSSTVLLTVGLWTRLNNVLVFLCLASIQQRNLFILHGGDTFLRLAGFFLIFAPAGAAVSLDHFIRVRRGKEPANVRPRSPWAQRMIQIQLSLLYFAAFLVKIKGAPWLQGTALFYVYHLDELRRFPMPGWFFHPLIMMLGSWFALALEFSLGVLIWVREFRYYLLALGLAFHMFLEYSLNIPLFQWDILSAYVLFIDGDDLLRAGRAVRGVFGMSMGRPAKDAVEAAE